MSNIQDTVILDATKNRSGWRIRIFWFAGVFTAIVFSLMIIAAWHIILAIAPYVIGLLSLCITGCLLWLLYELYQFSQTTHAKHDAERRIIKAQAAKAEAEARAAMFFTFSRSEGVIQHTPTGLNVLALPAPSGGQNVIIDQANGGFDFFELMTQTRRAFALFGGQQTGKSTKMHHIVRYWQDQGVKPVVIGQKFDSFEYTAGVMRFGPDAKSIVEGFELIRQEAQARQELANRGTSFSDMLPLPVILEDATSLNSVIDKADYETFSRQVLTVYAARMIIVYFVVHGMTLDAFGLKVGAALKNNLTCLYFETPMDKARFTIEDVTITGSNSYASRQDDRLPVTSLPAGFATLTDDCEPALYSLTADIPKRTMTVRERDILRQYGQGKTVSQIAQDCYGATSSFNNSKVKDVLSRFDIPVIDGRTRE